MARRRPTPLRAQREQRRRALRFSPSFLPLPTIAASTSVAPCADLIIKLAATAAFAPRIPKCVSTRTGRSRVQRRIFSWDCEGQGDR